MFIQGPAEVPRKAEDETAKRGRSKSKDKSKKDMEKKEKKEKKEKDKTKKAKDSKKEKGQAARPQMMMTEIFQHNQHRLNGWVDCWLHVRVYV